MPRRTLLSLGSINADFQVRLDQPAASQETQLAHDFCRLSGGKASNTAFLGARFGHRSQLLGRVGDDELAEQALGPLREAGVELAGVDRVPGQSTGLSMIMVPPDAKKHIVLATNANDCWDVPALDALQRAIEAAEAPACLVCDYEVPAAAVRRAIETAARRGVPVVLDPSFPDRVECELLGRLAAITPNAGEAGQLLGMAIDSVEQAVAAARQLRARGVPAVCIKLGDGGCVLDCPDGRWHIPGSVAEPVDTTGAGDAFTGVFAIALLEGKDALHAAAWGVAASQHAVTGYGSQPAYPTRAEVERLGRDRLQQARSLE